MRKAQIISMDFIMTFVVYIFALSVFFFSLGKALTFTDSITLDIPAELMFSGIDQTTNRSNDFLDGSRINAAVFDYVASIASTDQRYYDFNVFKNFENANLFKKIDYCVYLENKTAQMPVIRNFRTWDKSNYPKDYSILLSPGVYCGQNYNLEYNATPYCNESIKSEAIVLTKPILYGRDIMDLKIFICAEKK